MDERERVLASERASQTAGDLDDAWNLESFFFCFFLPSGWMGFGLLLLLSLLPFPGQTGWAGCFRADMTDWLACLLACLLGGPGMA